MEPKRFDSIEKYLRWVNMTQPDPAAVIHGAVQDNLDLGEYGLARELLGHLEDTHEYQITITRTESKTVVKTAMAVGPNDLCQEALRRKWSGLSGAIDFTNTRADGPDFEIDVDERI